MWTRTLNLQAHDDCVDDIFYITAAAVIMEPHAGRHSSRQLGRAECGAARENCGGQGSQGVEDVARQSMQHFGQHCCGSACVSYPWDLAVAAAADAIHHTAVCLPVSLLPACMLPTFLLALAPLSCPPLQRPP